MKRLHYYSIMRFLKIAEEVSVVDFGLLHYSPCPKCGRPLIGITSVQIDGQGCYLLPCECEQYALKTPMKSSTD